MSTTIPTIEPKSFYAGDTVKWKRCLTNYKASDGWTLKYSIKGATNITEITSSADGDNHLVELSAATTAGFTAGNYWYQAYVEKATERYTIDSGRMEIKADLSDISAVYDGREHAQKVLDALEATLEGKASLDQLSYSINGRSLSRLSPTELLEWKREYERKVAKLDKDEDQRKGRATGSNKVLVRF